MGRIIAVVNQKGGVGKTTTAVNLTAALTELGKKVLLCDFDPQANATSGLGLNKRKLKNSVYDVVVNDLTTKEAIVETKFGDVLPATADLAGAAVELLSIPESTFQLKNALNAVKADYDLIFIDCPPSLGILTINALTACDALLVPIQCEFFALEGLAQLMSTVRQVKRLYNPDIDIEGVLLTMYDGRLNLTQQVVEEVKRYFPRKVFASVIPRSVRISEAPSHGKPIMYYDRANKGSDAYINLAKEIIKDKGKR